MQPSEESDGKAAIWAFVAILVIFKIVTMAYIFTRLQSFDAGMIITATSWYWIPLLAVLIAAPVLFWSRLMKARRKRADLLRSEWMINPEPSSHDHPAPTQPDRAPWITG